MRRILYAIVPVVLGAYAEVVSANGPAVPAPGGTGVEWVGLRYEAAVSVAKTDAEIRLARSMVEETRADLIPVSGRSVLLPREESVLVLSLDSVVKGGLFSTKRYRGRVWFEPGDGRSLQRSRLREGSDGNLRVYRFTDTGVFRLRLEPRSKKESDEPPSQWGSRSENFFPFDPDALGCPTVVDPAALLYLVSAGDWVTSQRSESFCVFNKRELYRVTITSLDTEVIDVSFTLGEGGVERTVAGGRNVRRVRLEPELLGSASDPEPFEFLGLERSIDLLVDQELGIPLRVIGYTPRVGEGALDLARVELAGPGQLD